MISCTVKKNRGFTLVELMIVIAIIATLAAIASPMYSEYQERARVTKAKAEIRLIGNEILSFYFEWDRFPTDLEEIGLGGMLDPYGNPYQYLPIVIGNNGKPKIGAMRKDHNMVPVNTDFDLYSMGKDGKTAAPFTAKASRDDIVRANNGQYIGPVSGY